MVRDTTGRKSASLTMLWIAFAVVTASYVGASIGVAKFDAAGAAAYFTVAATLYAGRRYTAARFEPPRVTLSEEKQ